MLCVLGYIFLLIYLFITSKKKVKFLYISLKEKDVDKMDLFGH